MTAWINQFNDGPDMAIVTFFYTNCGGTMMTKVLWEIATFTGDGVFFFAAIPVIIGIGWAMNALPVLSTDQMYLVVYLGLTVVLDFVLNLLIKGLFRRDRPLYHKHDMRFPGPDKYSFPSGHATRVGCLFAWIVEMVKYEPKLLAVGLSLLPYFENFDVVSNSQMILSTGMFWVVMNCVGRLALGRHFASDVSKVAAGHGKLTSEESAFDLDAEEERIKALQEKHKLVVQYIVENVFPFAPVSVKMQRLVRPEAQTTEENKSKKQTYLWITVDEMTLKKQNVSINMTFKYPVAVAIDNDGNAFVTDQSASQRKLKAAEIVALANATCPPPAPHAPTLISATIKNLTVAWSEVNGSIMDRFEVQYQLIQKSTSVLKAWSLLPIDILARNGTLDGLTSNVSYLFRARCRNPAGWSEYGPVGGPFTTLAGAPEKPHAIYPAVISDCYINMIWPPVDDHGSRITAYTLEMRKIPDVGKEEDYKVVYCGLDCEYLCSGLEPKTVYGFRLKAKNIVGDTAWLESRVIRTSLFARPEVQELPTGTSSGSERWVECWDPKEEKVFYFNKFTCQRTFDEPSEVAEMRKKKGDNMEESPELIFRKKRFHFHRELRNGVPPQTSPFDVSVNRATVFQDTVSRMTKATKKELWSKPRITFNDEGGIDSGGLTKDWYLEVSKAAIHDSHGLFRSLDKEYFEINPEADSPEHLKLFRFLGKFIAKAIFDRHVLALPIAPIIFKHIVGNPITDADLTKMDPQFAKSMEWILEHDVTDVIYETFSIERADKTIIDLKENGRDIDVSEVNKLEYVQLMKQWRTEYAVRSQLDAVLTGLHTLIPPSGLHSFTWDELQLLVNGNPVIDVDQIRASAIFQGGYDANAQVVLWLWQALRSWDNNTRQLFLKFTTGSTTIPLDGFEPPFTITKSDLDPMALPRSHTCFNQLVLPEFAKYEHLVDKVVFAVQNTQGFELS
ncbi:HECT E3 ubiquitin ligase [Thraustotheca clavata]|uniref:HECT-type E3 ubiquitin transferase n=1 Tax=Thraustotheca clavata TaxID=74557 RepID=A0A1V9ZDB4_9STRA|nr:HECT E3 ubiquitin ligase [Thraustotheca clavata]